MASVTPCEGVGVETRKMSEYKSSLKVTPCEGVGVETWEPGIKDIQKSSRLARAWE